MLKIGTHDSITGEKSFWLSLPLVPFARTQSKTIKEQYYAGCRVFDIRAKYAFGKWRGAHGWWFTSKGLEEILCQINGWADISPICVHLTYEGKAKNSAEFKKQAEIWIEKYSNIIWGPICTKYSDNSLKVRYTVLIPPQQGAFGGTQAFLPLDGKYWQTWIPIPWLWKQFYFKNVEFNKEYYQIVDFL